MISTSYRVALSALFLAGALGLASTGVARAESVMKECGDEWKVAKANSATNGMTWQEFLKQCRAQKESSAAPAAAPAAAPGRRQPTSRNPSPPKRRRALPGPASSRRRLKRRRAAHPIKWSGSTPSRIFIIMPALTATARPSRGPICAKPTPARRAIAPPRAGSIGPSSSPKSAARQGEPSRNRRGGLRDSRSAQAKRTPGLSHCSVWRASGRLAARSEFVEREALLRIAQGSIGL